MPVENQQVSREIRLQWEISPIKRIKQCDVLERECQGWEEHKKAFMILKLSLEC